MKKYNKLVRDNVSDLLEDKGYSVKTKQLDDGQYKTELYSLFLHEFKDCKQRGSRTKVEYYADMLEVIRHLMLANNVSISELKDAESQPIKWYKKILPRKLKLKLSETNLLQKYDELLQVQNPEVMKEQLTEFFNAFKEVIEANELTFKQVEIERRNRLVKLGGFDNRTYLEGVSKTVNTAKTL